MDVIHAVDSEWPDQILCTNEELENGHEDCDDE
jgi:hypothetical protein